MQRYMEIINKQINKQNVTGTIRTLNIGEEVIFPLEVCKYSSLLQIVWRLNRDCGESRYKVNALAQGKTLVKRVI